MFSTSIIAKIIKETSQNLFLYPGGTIAPLLHECKRMEVNLIVSKQEQGAGYMALAEATLYNKPSFVAVTSGPGITNLITVIADAYYDSIPLIILSGQVSTSDLKRCSTIRQRGFQEVPTVDLVKNITKSVFQPKSVNELSNAIHQAMQISNSGRKGPVVIDMPMDVQLTKIDEKMLSCIPEIYNKKNICKYPKYETSKIEEIIEHINHSKKPLFLIGAGAQEEWKTVREFVKKSNIPAVSSLRGIGVLNQELTSGWIGHTGLPWANAILNEANTIIVLGSRLDIRQTGSQTEILDHKKIIHVDIDIEELNNCRIKNTVKLHMPIQKFIEQCNISINPQELSPWLSQIQAFKKSMKLEDFIKDNEIGLSPKEVLDVINTFLENKISMVTTGVGSHQHWVPRYIDFDNAKCKLFTSAGHGTMGYGLPVALGLQYLHKDILTLCIDGDGSFQMNLQELVLIKMLNLKVKILIMDNNRLGIVSQFQNITFQDDPTTGNVSNPDFVSIAKAYGIKSFYMETLEPSIIQEWLNSNEATLLHVKIKHDTPLSPMLLGGQELNNMWYSHEK